MYLSIYKALPKTVHKNDEAISKHLKKKKREQIKWIVSLKGKVVLGGERNKFKKKKNLVFARK